MLAMLRLELVGLVLLACTQILTEQRDFYGPRNQYGHRNSGSRGSHHGARTREVQIKYGRLRGTVVQPKVDNLQLVDVFLGVPYAEPPVGQHRFEPPTTQTPWTGVRYFVNFAPVCPQVLPNTEEEVDVSRHEYLKRLLPFLQNQSEDCLYLNIYAPHQNNSQKNNLEKYPVIVFIHGESYEWNSGNPYDGSVLAAYGNVVFVTVNFRLGILGFLRPGTKDDTASNFGLLDQIAVLVWLKDNIERFGGDPNSITLLGHGTGAVFVNLLMLSPTTDGLFKRAILMSGSAFNPDAIGKAPLQITKQVAYALNCPQITDDELVACLKNRSVEDLLNVKIHKPKFVPAFAPLVESAVIPDKPANLMKNAERLARFDLMYGVTELEKFHMLPGVALLEGLSDAGRDEFIRDSVKASHELEPDLILRKVLAYYRDEREDRMRTQSDEYEWNRDIALEVTSDSWIVAPLIAAANLHSRANPKSYMYVFSHLRFFRDQVMQDLNIQRTLHGEELPYVLGVPLNGEGYHLSASYDKGEVLLSKAMMDWWCNFAYSGNPNNIRPPPRRFFYLRDEYEPSSPYRIDWPEYDPENQTYFNLTIPPQIGHRYRAAEMEFWNEAMPHLLRRPKAELSVLLREKTTRRPRPGLLNILDRDYGGVNGSGSFGEAQGPANVRDNSTSSSSRAGYGLPPWSLGDGKPDKSNGASEDGAAARGGASVGGGGGSSPRNSSSAVSLLIGFGVVFLLINATALIYLYRKRQRMRKKASSLGKPLAQSSSRRSGGGGRLPSPCDPTDESKHGKVGELGYCSSTSKPDIREIIKNDKAYDNNSNFGRRSRENSTSTIDTRVKVREWIQQEIVHRCSPRFLRKTRETLQREHREKLMRQQRREEDEEQLRQLDEALYEAAAAGQEIRVRPGGGAAKGAGAAGGGGGRRRPPPPPDKPAKVSVAVDATPAARTHSVLNQTPIELAKASSEYLNSLEDAATVLGASEYCEPAELRTEEIPDTKGGANIVVIEHHHSRSDPLPMDKTLNYSTSKAISASVRINESDSGSASSLYAKINPRMKSRLPVHQHKHLQQEQQTQHSDTEPHSQTASTQQQQQQPVASGGSSTLPRLLTFGSPAHAPSLDVNVTSRETNPNMTATAGSNSHEEALRTIRRRNYPKVLPDIEKRRSLPPNASFVVGGPRQLQPQGYFAGQHRQITTPPSPPPRLYGTSRSLDCVEDKDEEEDKDCTSVMPVTTRLHVGPLRRKTDSPKNQSVPSLTDATDDPKMFSATSLPVCPIHGAPQETFVPGAKSEPRILIVPISEINEKVLQRKIEENVDRGDDQPDCPPRRAIPERATKLPRIIIKPTQPTGTLSRSHNATSTARTTANPNNLQDNETYQRLLARREKMPLPGEMGLSRIPSITRRTEERAEVVQRVNMPDAAVTKL